MSPDEFAALKLNPSQEVTLYPSRAKWIGIFLLMALFAVAALAAAIREHDPKAWVGGLVCAALAAFSLYQLFSKKNFLQLAAHGMHVRSLLLKYDVDWNNVGDVGVVYYRRNIVVTFNYRNAPA